MPPSPHLTRRDALMTALSIGVGLAGGRAVRAAGPSDSALPLITKSIPSTGEKLPTVGVGTNKYDVEAADDIAARRAVLQRLPQLGGSVIDTAPLYGRAEAVIGTLVADLGNRDRLFLATKVLARDAAGGEASMQNSLSRLKVQRIDLMQVHNLVGVEPMLPVLQAWKKAGRIRYYGITTSFAAEYPRMLDYMQRLPLDFIQVDYSLGNRQSGKELLPLAQRKGIAVIANSPFGGRRAAATVFSRVAGHPLPDWAADIQATTWSQFFLKYVISHPAVTCAVPGTTGIGHLQDNQHAARGQLPDAGMRKRMEDLWDGLKT